MHEVSLAVTIQTRISSAKTIMMNHLIKTQTEVNETDTNSISEDIRSESGTESDSSEIEVCRENGEMIMIGFDNKLNIFFFMYE